MPDINTVQPAPLDDTALIDKDPITGVEYAHNDVYKPAAHWPSATLIPSHRGDFGAQYGHDDPLERMVVTVDPEFSDSYSYDPRKLTRATVHTALRAGKNLKDVYQSRDDDGKSAPGVHQGGGGEQQPAMTKKATSTAKPAAKSGGTTKKKKKSVRKASAPTGASPPASEPTLAPVASEVVQAALAEVADDNFTLNEDEVAHIREFLTRSGILPNVTPTPANADAAEVTVQGRDAVSAPQTPSSEVSLPPTEVQAPEEPSEEPTAAQEIAWPLVDVVFTTKAAGSISCKVHEATVQNGLVVLIYDTTFDYGTRYTPPTSSDTIIHITIRKPQQQPEEHFVLYGGIHFMLDDLEYTIYAVTDTPATAQPAE